MNVGVKIDGVMVLTVIGLAAVGYVFYKIYSNSDVIVNSFNPTSDQNLANRGANAIVDAASNGKYQTTGDWLWGTRDSNPISWAFDWLGHATGALN